MLSRLVLLLCFFSVYTLYPQDTHVYVSAHPDDWQLFMNPNAITSVAKADTKVVFLHTTAGDAGAGKGENDYYLAREEGSKRAIRFMVNAMHPELRLGADMNETLTVVNGHYVMRGEYGNAVVYFLRLPDGNGDGSGYPIHGTHSLKKFYAGEVPTLTTDDGNSTYSSPDDLKRTIMELIHDEIQAGGAVQFNVAETDRERNPGDHSDHLNTAYFLQDVAKRMGLKTIRLYEEYATANKPVNIEGKAYMESAATWGATVSGLSDREHYTTWDRAHNAWIGRQYYREIDLSEVIRN